MKRKHRRKGVHRKFKHLAAAMAGAAILSSAMLPGVAPPKAQASAAPVSDGPPTVNAHQTIGAAEMLNQSTISERITPLPMATTPPNSIVSPQIIGLETLLPSSSAPSLQPNPALKETSRELHAMERGIKPPPPALEEPAAAEPALTPAVETPLDTVEASAPPVTLTPLAAETPATPVKEIAAPAPIAVAAKAAPTTPAQPQSPTSYKEVINVKATAYAPGPHDNDQWGSLTHLGTQVRPGVIAVDPRIIPLGSRVYIEYPDGTGTYATAEDTGGAIKGNRIDVAKWTVREAQDFGIQSAKVYVIRTPEKI